MAINKLDDKYYMLGQLLLTFLLDNYLDEKNDLKSIQKYCEQKDKDEIEETIKEGLEVLELEPFPHEWVGDITDRLVYDNEKKEWVNTPELYKEWVKEIINLLHTEARKLGKI